LIDGLGILHASFNFTSAAIGRLGTAAQRKTQNITYQLLVTVHQPNNEAKI
jgi:hypothetical protein